jgi:hypothetical protein
MTTVRALGQLATAAAALIALASTAMAQFSGLDCPGRWVNYGGGQSCQCPDGNLANYVGGRVVCNQAPAAAQQVGDNCSNGGTCPVGSRCSSMPGRCVPVGRVDCGTYHCAPGNKCSSTGCIAEAATDCGNKLICGTGAKCSRDGKSCLAAAAVDCGSYNCSAGLKCSSGNRCVARTDVDCGGGRTCPAGQLCVGSAECRSVVELTEKLAAERRKKAEEEVERKRLADEAEAKKKADEAQRLADKRKREEEGRVAGQHKKETDAIRNRLWPVKGVSSNPAKMNAEKVKQDWMVIQMASAAYSDKLVKGENVFKGNSDWKVADKRFDQASGLFAYVLSNRNEGRMVVAFRGSNDPRWLLTPNVRQSRDAAKDWAQDIAAYFGGKQPAQFKVAESMLKDIKKEFGAHYSIECVGHSLGGADCVYAAAQVPGVHGVAIDPISANSIATRNAYLIDNYVVPGNASDAGSSVFERGITGYTYRVESSNVRGPLPIEVSQSTPSVIDPLGTNMIARHSVEGALDAIGKDAGLERSQMNEQ